MADTKVVPNTFLIEKLYPRPIAQVFACLADPSKKRRWFAEGDGHDVEQFDMDFREGGLERVQYRLNQTTPFPGAILVHQGHYLDIQAMHRTVIAATMTFGGKRISSSLITTELLPESTQTRLVLTHQAVFFEGADGPEIRKMGWEIILNQLFSAVTA